jgi:hypothetical protein
MKQLQCAYCPQNHEKFLHDTYVYWPFGIRHCEEHSADAKRDCRLYKQTEGIVSMTDAKDHPHVAPLIALLESGEIPITRTSGSIETGWKPYYGPTGVSNVPFIQRNDDNVWMIPMTNDLQTKSVPIISFLPRPEAALTLATLENGFYVDDREIWSLHLDPV